jgi:NADH-quinone oxidoreductase subunit J
MSLVVTLVAIAALFVMLGAPFVASLQVLIYTGAIVVLFLFVVMLLNIGREEASQRGLPQKVTAGLGALAFFAFLATAYVRLYWGAPQAPLSEDFVSMRALALELFTDYLLTFELVGLLLLVAVIAATVLAAKPKHAPEPSGDGSEEVA